MKTITIEGKTRDSLGKKGTKALRKEGLVPAVVYGGEQNIHFAATPLSFRDLIYTDELRKAEIKVGDQTIHAIVKDLQFHPVTDRLLHIDFVQLTEGKKVKTDIPVRLTGSPVGVKAGGNLVQAVRRVTVLTTPDSLTSYLEADVSHLDLGKSVRVRDIKVDDNTQIMNSPSIPIGSIEIPRALRSAQAKAAAEAKA
ncbi:MAG: 50S ribosomal protein L25 [Saprospiraceae bacterium]|nr:50S ribosomal protein L25 [Saprospiraceae bacterium]